MNPDTGWSYRKQRKIFDGENIGKFKSWPLPLALLGEAQRRKID